MQFRSGTSQAATSVLEWMLHSLGDDSRERTSRALRRWLADCRRDGTDPYVDVRTRAMEHPEHPSQLARRMAKLGLFQEALILLAMGGEEERAHAACLALEWSLALGNPEQALTAAQQLLRGLRPRTGWQRRLARLRFALGLSRSVSPTSLEPERTCQLLLQLLRLLRHAGEHDHAQSILHASLQCFPNASSLIGLAAHQTQLLAPAMSESNRPRGAARYAIQT